MSDTCTQLQLFDLAQRQVLVVGLGESGLAMARWVARNRGQVRVADTRADPAHAQQLSVVAPSAILHTGALSETLLDGIDLIAWSPGLSIELGDCARFYQQARARGIQVVGEIELFAQALAQMAQGDYRPKLIAITGSNGKTTTTSLVEHLCRSAGIRATPAGNIGPAALDALADAIDAQELPQVWVLELSSFQLALTDSLVADAAVILNVSQDHLDWHATMASYVAAKRRVYNGAKAIVVNRDDEATWPQVPENATPRAKSAGRPATRSFGLSAPTALDELGIVADGALDWIAEGVVNDNAPRRRGKETVPCLVTRLMPVEALRLRGRHNQANALAALALLRAIDVPLTKSLHGLRKYEGPSHRCQWIASIDGVDYIDDSKGTNVGATAAALIGLGKRCVLIAGGQGKGQDFGPLLAPVRANARAVVLIGRDASLIEQALRGCAVPIEHAESMQQAVRVAAAQARPGDVVLMSPACASFDMFRDYGHRAQVFTAAVHELADEHGVIA